MSTDLIAKMRGRIDQCRNLAKWISDPAAAKILLAMADEGEADLKELQAKEAARPND
jgi:hypothetical protein